MNERQEASGSVELSGRARPSNRGPVAEPGGRACGLTAGAPVWAPIWAPIWALVWALAFTGAASAQELRIQSERVAVGATELAANPGVGGGYSEWNQFSTFYNTSVTQVGGWYYLWTQVGWDAAGCRSSNEGLDNVVVFKASSPGGFFYPRACSSSSCGGSINPGEMRASLVTDTQNLSATDPDQNGSDQCDPNFMWGLGDVVPYSGSQYIATYDLSKNGLGPAPNGDHAKFHLYLSASDGRDRTSKMHLFAETVASQSPRQIIYDPVPFKVDSNTVGVIFSFARSEDFGAGGTGYMYLDFSSFPASFSVKVLASDNTYRTLPASRAIDFQFKDIGAGGEVNRVLFQNGEWRAYMSRALSGDSVPSTCAGTQGVHRRLAHRTFSFYASGSLAGRWIGWSGSPQDILLWSGSAKQYDSWAGILFPSPIVAPDGSTHLFFSQDNEHAQLFGGFPGCGDFAGMDQMHAVLAPFGAPQPPSGTPIASDTFAAGTGTAINGRSTPVGLKTWVASGSAIISSSQSATGTTGGNPIASLAFNPASYGFPNAIVRGKLDPRGSSWAALGFHEHATWGWWVDGKVWLLMTPSGTFSVYCDGTAGGVATGIPVPSFNAAGYNDVILAYDSATRLVEVWVNGQQAVAPVALPASCSGAVAYAGFSALGSTQNLTRIDDFALEID